MANSNTNKLRISARLGEYEIKTYEIKAQPLSITKTYLPRKNFAKKMGKISDMDWAQHIKMDYAPKFEKRPYKSQTHNF